MIDLHMHSRKSDGTDSIPELYAKVKAAGIRTFALTDHDTLAGVDEMLTLTENDPSVKFVPGVEFSTEMEYEGKNHKVHVVGLGFRRKAEEIAEVLADGLDFRQQKFTHIVDFLEDRFGVVLTPEELSGLRKIPNVGKPHFAEILMQRDGITRPEAFDRYFKNYESPPGMKVTTRDAVEAIAASGGVAVWAHPLGDSPLREKHKTPAEIAGRLALMKSWGLEAAEGCYSRYGADQEDELIALIRSLGLHISGGSDYHGTGKNVALGQLGTDRSDASLINVTELL